MNEYFEFKKWALKKYPLSRLELLSGDAFSELCECEPEAPEEYTSFLASFGFGSIGDSVFQIYNYPLDADSIFDKDTADEFTEYKFVADNFSGYMIAYRTSGPSGWELVAFQHQKVEELPKNLSTIMQAIKSEL